MTRTLQHIFCFCLALFLFVGLTTAVSPQNPSALLAKLDDPLQEMAERNDIVDIIVQQEHSAGENGDVASLINDLGGVVTNNLPIINGLAAKLPASSVTILAQNPNIKHISLDNVINSSSYTSKILLNGGFEDGLRSWQISGYAAQSTNSR